MPLVYEATGVQRFVIRRPPSHFVFATDKDLITRHSVKVHRTWAEELEPLKEKQRLEVDHLIQFDGLIDRMALFTPIQDGADYLIDFQGSEISRIFGEGVGQKLSITPKAHFEALLQILDLVRSSRSVVVNGPALNALPDRLFLVSQSLFMPVVVDEDKVKQILAYSDYFTQGKVEKV